MVSGSDTDTQDTVTTTSMETNHNEVTRQVISVTLYVCVCVSLTPVCTVSCTPGLRRRVHVLISGQEVKVLQRVLRVEVVTHISSGRERGGRLLPHNLTR